MAMGIVLIAPIASAAPSLWLYPSDAGPREGGHVVPPGTPFTLVIENRGKDSDTNTAHGVELVIAVENPEVVDTLELAFEGGETTVLVPGDWGVGVPVLPCSEKLMPRHGVYPAAFLEITLFDLTGIGDLVGGQSVEIEVTVEGQEGLRVHFDAMATGYKKNGRCFDILNPSGHDVTVANRPGGQDECGRVRIKKTADPGAVDLFEQVHFVIEILNNGTCDLNELVVQDLIPVVENDDGETYAAFEWSPGEDPPPKQIDDFVLEWRLDLLPNGESTTVEFVASFNELLADQRRVVNRACVSAAERPEPRCTTAVVLVGNPYGEDGPAGPGFWCHATRWLIEDRPKVPVDGEELLAWFETIAGESAVFSGEYKIFFEDDPEASFIAAADILCKPQLAAGAADRLARHLLTLRLNVVSERLDRYLTLGDLCMGDEILPEGTVPEMTVEDLIVAAEDSLLAGDDDEQLNFWSEVVDAVNNSYVVGEGECVTRRLTTRRQMTGGGRPGGKSTVSKIRN
jgi:uncharacterized repeat protein (TIGR01451 family)